MLISDWMSNVCSTYQCASADPIQTIDPETAKLQGQVQLADVLQSTPAAQGSIQITSAISNRFVANGGNDVQTVSLRGLGAERSEEHTSELQSLMRISYAVFCLKKKTEHT